MRERRYSNMKDGVNWTMVKIAGWCVTALGGIIASVAADQINQQKFEKATERYLENKESQEQGQQ